MSRPEENRERAVSRLFGSLRRSIKNRTASAIAKVRSRVPAFALSRSSPPSPKKKDYKERMRARRALQFPAIEDLFASGSKKEARMEEDARACPRREEAYKNHGRSRRKWSNSDGFPGDGRERARCVTSERASERCDWIDSIRPRTRPFRSVASFFSLRRAFRRSSVVFFRASQNFRARLVEPRAGSKREEVEEEEEDRRRIDDSREFTTRLRYSRSRDAVLPSRSFAVSDLSSDPRGRTIARGKNRERARARASGASLFKGCARVVSGRRTATPDEQRAVCERDR